MAPVSLHSELDIWIPQPFHAEVPVDWWDSEADKSLLLGVFKHGKESCLRPATSESGTEPRVSNPPLGLLTNPSGGLKPCCLLQPFLRLSLAPTAPSLLMGVGRICTF